MYSVRSAALKEGFTSRNLDRKQVEYDKRRIDSE